jgi:hypothetical protein
VGPSDWTVQGYPYFSGTGIYRTTAEVPAELERCRLRLDVPTRDDAVEVVVNGACAGVRLWDPYEVDATDLLRTGTNEIEIRVSNTPANLLNGERRASGLSGPPVLVPLTPVRLEVRL